MKPKLIRLNELVDRYNVVFWIMLFVSVIVGLGKEEVPVNSEATRAYIITTISMAIILFTSGIVNMYELIHNRKLMTSLTKCGVTLITLALFVLSYRIFWNLIFASHNYTLAPAAMVGASLLGIGTLVNSLGRIYDWRNYVKS